MPSSPPRSASAARPSLRGEHRPGDRRAPGRRSRFHDVRRRPPPRGPARPELPSANAPRPGRPAGEAPSRDPSADAPACRPRPRSRPVHPGRTASGPRRSGLPRRTGFAPRDRNWARHNGIPAQPSPDRTAVTAWTSAAAKPAAARRRRRAVPAPRSPPGSARHRWTPAAGSAGVSIPVRIRAWTTTRKCVGSGRGTGKAAAISARKSGGKRPGARDRGRRADPSTRCFAGQAHQGADP